MDTSSLVPALSLVLSIGSVAFGGLATWLVTRRKTSGRIGTSDAAELWNESKAIRDTLGARLEKTEAQRDRLIEAQAGQVLPVMAAVNQSMQDLAASIEIITANSERDRARNSRIETLLGRLLESYDARRHVAEDPGEGRGD